MSKRGTPALVSPYRNGVMRALCITLRFVDRRRVFLSHRAMFEEDYSKAADMEPYCIAEGRRVVVVIPASLESAPVDVVSETACSALRRALGEDAPCYGPTALAFFRTPLFRRSRAKHVGRMAFPIAMADAVARRGTVPNRLDAWFYGMMESPPLTFLGDLMRVRTIWFVRGAKGRIPQAVVPDPWLRMAFVDMQAMDPLEARGECMVLMFRACAYIECYDRMRCRLDARRYLLMLSMYPNHDRLLEACRARGMRFCVDPCEVPPMLPGARA